MLFWTLRNPLLFLIARWARITVVFDDGLKKVLPTYGVLPSNGLLDDFGSFCDDLNESAVCQNHSLEGRKASTQASRRNCDINVETQTKHSSKNNSRNEPAKLRKWAKQGPSKLRVEKFGPTKLLPRISFTSWYKAKKPPIQIIRKLLVIPFRRYVTSQH